MGGKNERARLVAMVPRALCCVLDTYLAFGIESLPLVLPRHLCAREGSPCSAFCGRLCFVGPATPLLSGLAGDSLARQSFSLAPPFLEEKVGALFLAKISRN